MEIEFDFPVLMIKSSKFVDFIYKLGKKHSKFFIFLGDIAVFLAVFGALVAFDFLVRGAAKVVEGGPAQVSILIPGVKLPGSSFSLPLFEGIIVIFLLAIFHEGFHALIASAQGIKPKYFAFLLFLFIPAAGVEIDEEELKKRKKIERARIFSAGSLGNLILALLCFALLFPTGSILEKGIKPEGLLILNVTNQKSNLKPGLIITGINGSEAKTIEELRKILNGIKPGEYVEIETKNGTFVGKTIEENGRTMLGVYLKPLFKYEKWWANPVAFLARIMILSFQINIGVALINLLPTYFLDGGRLLEDISPKSFKLAAPALLLLLLFNLAGPYLPL